MIKDENRQKQEADLQRLRAFRLIDDDFMTKCFEGNTKCIELVLGIILDKPDTKMIFIHIPFMKNVGDFDSFAERVLEVVAGL